MTFQAALKFWQEFNVHELQVAAPKWLNTLCIADIYFICLLCCLCLCVCPRFQRELDSQAQEVVKRQDDSEASRKKLVELSREFKRTSTEVRKLYLPTLPALVLYTIELQPQVL